MMRFAVLSFAVQAWGCGTVGEAPQVAETPERAERAETAERSKVAEPPEEVEPGARRTAIAATDLMSITELTARITVVHDSPAVACGVLHVTGYVEVEVLGAGEPPPSLALFVSCPFDPDKRDLLAVGNVVRVALHTRPQDWPTPQTVLPEGLPIRQVRVMALANGVVEPPR